MEFEGGMPRMQLETWTRYIRGGFEPRRGQRDLFEIAATRTLKYDEVNVLRAVLPTGYGKTLAGLGTYLILRAQGMVNRLLVLVPNDQLRQQWSTNAGKNAAKLGGAISGSVQLDNVTAAFRAVQSGSVEVVVATYAQLIYDSRGWLNEMLSSGHWMAIFDEFHHLAEEKAWGISAGRLIKEKLCRVALMLSATPIRTDKRHTVGGGLAKDGDGLIFKPDVCVTLKEALSEEAIRQVKAHIHHYFVDVLPDGAQESVRVTTEMLKQEGVTDFSAYEARRELRYVGEYLSRILVDAVNIYEARNLQHSRQHQILVFAMTQRHAEAVAKQINLITGPGFADWIGVDRTESDAILKRYQDNQLPCLVQVDKAGEGFDNERASILVFLNLIKSGAKLTQQVGRGFRRNYTIPFREDCCQVLASADTELAEYVSNLEIELRLEEKMPGEGGEDVDRWPLFRDPLEVSAEYDRLELVHHAKRDAEMEAILAMAKADGAPVELEQMDMEWLRRLLKRVRGDGAKGVAPTEVFPDETAKRNHYQQKAEAVLKTFVRKAVELYGAQNGGGFNAQLLGPYKIAVHTRWNKIKNLKHDEMMGDEFKAKFYWLRDEYEKMRTLREIPEWLKPSSHLTF